MPDNILVQILLDNLANETDLLRRMMLITIIVDCANDPDSAIDSYPFDEDVRRMYRRRELAELVTGVAKELDASPDDIVDEVLGGKETRSAIVQSVMNAVQMRRSVEKLRSFVDCNFSAAVDYLVGTSDEEPTPTDELDILSSAAIYFFAIRPDIIPTAPKNLTHENEQELDKIFGRMTTFYAGYSASHDDKTGFFKAYIDTFHDEEIATEGRNQYTPTALVDSDMMYSAMSKPYRRQMLIAAQGANGAVINVGGNAKVQISITDTHGEGVALSQEDIGLQNVVGDIIARNGKNCIVTPDQLFRAYKGLSSDATVNSCDIDFINERMSKMMKVNSRIDYADQIEKHKRLKRQADVDYQKVVIEQALIPAKYVSIKNNMGNQQDAYQLYDYPALYWYSHAVNQIGVVKRSLLTSSAGKRGKGKKKGDYLTTDQTTVRRYLIGRIDEFQRTTKTVKAKSVRTKTSLHNTCAVHHLNLYDKDGEIGVLSDFNADSEQRKRTLRKNIETTLEAWKNDPDSPISSWEPKMGQHGKLEGYKISIPFSAV